MADTYVYSPAEQSFLDEQWNYTDAYFGLVWLLATYPRIFAEMRTRVHQARAERRPR